jgi:hypothetical protein
VQVVQHGTGAGSWGALPVPGNVPVFDVDTIKQS